MQIGLGIGITKRNNAGGVSFPNNISDPIEKAIVQALGITEAEYNANGIANYVAAWWAADEGVTGFPNVTAWTDKSGNNITVTNVGTSPQLVSNTNSNTPAIRWAAGTDELQVIPGIFTGSVDRTVLVVYETSDNPTSSTRIIQDGDTPALLYSWWTITTELAVRVNGGVALFEKIPSGLPELIAVTQDGTQTDDISIRSNGADVARTSLTSSLIDTVPNKFQIGALAFEGDVMEIIMIPQALNNAQKEAMESAIADKYGITLA